MGLLDQFERVNAYGKKRCRSLFWRVRAAVKKALKKEGKQRFKFEYDPLSYALNFDDGSCHHIRDAAAKIFIADGAAVLHQFTDINNTATTWVYVLWIKTITDDHS